MGHIEKSVHIEAPPERVWEVLIDAERPEWNEEFVAVEDMSGPLDHAGAGYAQVMRIGPRRVKGEVRGNCGAAAPWPGDHLDASADELRARPRPARAPAGGTRETVELDYELKGGALTKLVDSLILRRMMERTFERNGRNLKRLVESTRR